MTDALRYELARIRTIRSTWWLSLLSLVLGIGISTLLAWALHHEFSTNGSVDLEEIGAALATQLSATDQVPSLISFLMAIVGVFAWGHEYRHGMIRASLTAVNPRRSLWVAKYLVVGLWVAVVSLVTMAISALIGQVILHGYVTVINPTTVRVVGFQTLYAVLLTWLAMAFTTVTRSQAFALVTMFLWPLLIESLVFLIFNIVPQWRDDTDLLRFLPFKAGGRMSSVLGLADDTFGNPLSPLGATIVFGGITVILMAVAFALFERRDA